ncbi:UNVERIFIED_CONTAM: hypothetical protein FKN15_014717 [Acipenser sinensis]
MLLPPRALVQGRTSHWQAPQARTVTRAVQVPTALLGDLRHLLQATAAEGNGAPPHRKGKAGRGASTQQRSRRQFQGRCPRQLPQSAPPRPQQPQKTADTKPGLQGEASPDLQRTTSTSTESTAPAPEHPVRNRVGSELLFRDCNPLVLLLVIPIAG